MKIALLTNFIPPYRQSLYQQIINSSQDQLKIFISTKMEKNRNWEVNHDQLDVIVQKCLTYAKKWKHEAGFEESSSIHIPYDTILQLKKYNPDIVISCELGLRSLLASIYCKWHNKPLILWLTLSEHTEQNKKGLRKILRKYLLKSAKALFCNGESGKRYVSSLGVDKPTYFIPYTSDFTSKETAKENFHSVRTILFTGQLVERKGIKEMVNAIKTWAIKDEQTPVSLLVAGDGLEKIHFKELNKLTNVDYQLLGSVEYGKLQELYDQADVYLFPTLADEWGLVVNEALSRGVPVIGSLYSQAVEELIKEGENGWLFYPNQSQEFVEVLQKAIHTSEKELKRMSGNAIQSIQELTPEKVAEKIRLAIKKLNDIN